MKQSIQKYLDEEGMVERTTPEVFAEIQKHKSKDFVEKLRAFLDGEESIEYYQRLCETLNGMSVYDYLKSRLRQSVEWELKQALKIGRLQSEKREVIDVCCGNGLEAVFYALASRGNVTGIDFCPEMIELAKERAGKRNLQNINFQVGDRDSLPVDSGRFDLLTCFNSIASESEERCRGYDDGELFFNLVLNQRLQEFKRVLKPEGSMVLIFPLSQEDPLTCKYESDYFKYKLKTAGLEDIAASTKTFNVRDEQTFTYLIVSGKK